MTEHHTSVLETDNKKPLSPLVERLDPSIGELSTVLGAMMTELLRRTLRGSVSQIDEELQVQVGQKVDLTVAQRLPAIEQAAAEVADKAAREAATEVTFEGIRSLEQRAHEAERGLVARIETGAQVAAQRTAETARELAGQIEQVAKATEQAITTQGQELAGNIKQAVADKSRELSSSIEAAERRATESAQTEIGRQVDELMQRSKKTVAGMKDKLQTLEAALATSAGAIERLTKDLRAATDRQRQESAAWLQKFEALAARAAELEKPHGLRGLWTRLSGGAKKTGDS